MTLNRNLFVGITVSALLASILFAAGRRFSRTPQPGWNREQWLRLLSGANSGQ